MLGFEHDPVTVEKGFSGLREYQSPGSERLMKNAALLRPFLPITVGSNVAERPQPPCCLLSWHLRMEMESRTALPEVWWEAGREERVTAVSVLLDDDDLLWFCRLQRSYYDQTAPL